MSTRRILQANTLLPIAGAKAYANAIASLKTGQIVQVIPESDNPYDKNAMRIIDSSNQTVGYLPAKIAARVRHDLGDTSMVAKIAEVTRHDGKQVGARIRVCRILDYAG